MPIWPRAPERSTSSIVSYFRWKSATPRNEEGAQKYISLNALNIRHHLLPLKKHSKPNFVFQHLQPKNSISKLTNNYHRDLETFYFIKINRRQLLQMEQPSSTSNGAFNSESNPFSIENLIKKGERDLSNDSGYSAHSESGSEDGIETIRRDTSPISEDYFRAPTPINTVYQEQLYKNLLIYSNLINALNAKTSHRVNMVQVSLTSRYSRL